MRSESCFGSLYRFELLKIFKNKVAIITFLIMLVFGILQGELEVSGNVDKGTWEEYRTLNGRVIDDDLLGELVSVSDDTGRIADPKDIAYEDLGIWVQDVTGYGVAYKDLDASVLYESRYVTIEEAHELAGLTPDETAYWQEQEERVVKPFVYHDRLIPAGVLEGTSNHMIMMLIVIATALSSVFAMETQRKTAPMIRVSLNVRKVFFAKILAGMSYVTAAVILLLGSFYTYFGLRWRFDGMEGSIRTYLPFSQMDMSLWQLAAILIMLVAAGSVMVSAYALMISCITRNGLAAMAIVIGTHLGLFAISAMLPAGSRVLSQSISLLPATLVSPRLVYEFRMVKLGGYLLCYQTAPILYFLLTVVFIAAAYLCYDSKSE